MDNTFDVIEQDGVVLLSSRFYPCNASGKDVHDAAKNLSVEIEKLKNSKPEEFRKCALKMADYYVQRGEMPLGMYLNKG
jgi:hypothetical protein